MNVEGLGLYVLLLLILWLACGWIGYMVGASRNRAGAGFALGFCLGLLGVLLALFLPANPDPVYRARTPRRRPATNRRRPYRRRYVR